ncbi:MAG: bifunctional UDP-sugar hydrolase/5'-nucleotidase [Candidatus Rifleibacteriota bacterium]
MSSIASRLFLFLSVLLVIIVAVWLFRPNESRRYHLILTGVSKGRMHPFRAKFKPYKGKKMGGTAAIATLKNEAVASFSGEPFNFVSIGSEISGTADAYFTRGSAIISALNGLGIEAMLVGNIEFTFGQERLRELAKEADFAFLTSNVCESGTGQTPDYLSPEIILYPGAGLKVGMVGITPPSTPDLTFRGNVAGLEFHMPGSDLKARIAALRKAGVSLVVLLTLYDKERISYEEWKGIVDAKPDVCVMIDYSVEAPPPFMKNGIIIKTVSGYNKCKELDILDLELSPDPVRIISFAGRRLAANHAEIDPDPKVAKIVDKATRRVKALKRRKITDFADDYERQYSRECPIGNMIADAMRAETGATIAFQNSGGIQNNINSGEFTVGDLFDVLPFDNQVITMELKGSDIQELLTQSASLRRGVLQVSGASYSFAWRSQDDYELREVKVGDDPIDPEKTYLVCTNSFLADGGDNFLAFKNGRNVVYGRQQRDIVQEYLEKLGRDGPVRLATYGRITVEK